jgi:hypothetical protein
MPDNSEKVDVPAIIDMIMDKTPRPDPYLEGGIEVGLAPVAVAGPDMVAAPGELVKFDGSRSYDPDGTIQDYFWVFGDGNTADGMHAENTYTSVGTYTVSLMVTDTAGYTGYDYLMVLVKEEEEGHYASHLIRELLTELEEMDLPKGLENSLSVKLRSAEYAVERGPNSYKAAANKLNAFMNEVEAQMGKNKLGGEEGFELCTQGEWIIAQLEDAPTDLTETANTDWLHLLTERHYSTDVEEELVEFEVTSEKYDYLATLNEGEADLDFTAYEYSLIELTVTYTGKILDPFVTLDEDSIKFNLPDWWHTMVLTTPGELGYGGSGTYTVAVGAPGNHLQGTYEYSMELAHAGEAVEDDLEVVHYDSLTNKEEYNYKLGQQAVAHILNWDWTLETDQVHGLAPGMVLDLNMFGYGWVTPSEAMDILMEEYMECNNELALELGKHLVLFHGVELSLFTFAPGITVSGGTVYGDLRLSGKPAEFIVIENMEVHGDIIIEDAITTDITIQNSFARDIIIDDCDAYGAITVENNLVLGDISAVMMFDLVMTFNANTVGGNLNVLIGNVPGGFPAVGGFVQLTVSNCMVGTAGVPFTGDIGITIVSNWIVTNIATTVVNNYVYNDIIITEADNRVFWGVISTWVSGNAAFNDIMLYEPFLVDLPAGGPRINVGNTIVSWGGINKNVLNNRVGRNIGVIVSTTQMPVTGVIGVTVTSNTVGGFIGSQVSGNQQLNDIITTVQNNVCRDLFVMSSMNGNWFMRDIITDVQSNSASNGIWIDVDRNNVWRDLIGRLNANQATLTMDIDITNNWPRPYLTVTNAGVVTRYIGFSTIALSVRNNHVVKDDLVIDINDNRMTRDPSAYTSIYIEKNGAGGDVTINMNDNDIDFGSIIIQIMINKSHGDMDITIQRNRLNQVALITMIVSGNTGLNNPNINVEWVSTAVISGNVVFNAQAAGADGDGDGLSDNFEWIIGTSPTSADTDSDGLFDGWDDADGSRTWDWTDTNGNNVMDQGEFETLGEVGDPQSPVPNDAQGRYNGGIPTLFTVTTAWGTPLQDPSPFVQDVYVEADFMMGFQISVAAQNLVIASYGKQGIQLHIDNGWQVGPAGLGGATGTGGELLPVNNPLRFVDPTPAGGQKQFFDIYTLKNGETADLNGDGILEQAHLARNRLGIFHYTVIGNTYWQPGLQVPPQPLTSAGVSEPIGSDDFFVGEGSITIVWFQLWGWVVTNPAVMAGVFMHELGHNLGLPHQPDPLNPAAAGTAWGNVNYRSVMNSYSPTMPAPFPGGDLASYIYTTLDYSDGTNGPNDFNDWGNLDLITGITTWQNHNW